jgi:hypothetical protein
MHACALFLLGWVTGFVMMWAYHTLVMRDACRRVDELLRRTKAARTHVYP